MQAVHLITLLIVVCCFACNKQSFNKQYSTIDNINILCKTLKMHGLHFTNSDGFYPGIADTVSQNSVVINEDTLLRGTISFAYQNFSASAQDSQKCLRFFLRFDTVTSGKPFNFDASRIVRNWDELNRKAALGSNYQYWPKSIQPNIKWGTVVFPNKCIDITVHTYPYSPSSEEKIDTIINMLISFICSKYHNKNDIDKICVMLDQIMYDYKVKK